MLRSRNRVRTAALRAEIIALRATVVSLQTELATVRDAAAEAALAGATGETAAAAPAPAVTAAAAVTAPVTLDLPLVRLALSDVAVDRSPDAALTEIVLEPAAAPADRLAWSVLASLPERPLLDPGLDRDAEPVDLATAASVTAPATRHRRSA